jgi:hypothetical protein
MNNDRGINERLASIEVMVADIHAEIKGASGRKGLIDRVCSLENWRSAITGALALIVGWLRINRG